MCISKPGPRFWKTLHLLEILIIRQMFLWARGWNHSVTLVWVAPALAASPRLRKVLESQNEFNRCLHSTHPSSDLTLWLFREKMISPGGWGGVDLQQMWGCCLPQSSKCRRGNLTWYALEKLEGKTNFRVKLLICCWFSWCEIQFKFTLNTQNTSLSYLLLLLRDFSAQGLLQTPGGGQVGKGGGGSDGRGGRFLLPFPELGPKAGGVWCWNVLWGLGGGFMDGAPGSLYTFSGSPPLRLCDLPGRAKSKVPKMGSWSFFSVSSTSSFEGGEK